MVVNVGDYKLRDKFNKTELMIGLSQLGNVNNIVCDEFDSYKNKIDMNSKENVRVKKKQSV